jgi:pimeloyl-ACP methyl ester carboxylesterase
MTHGADPVILVHGAWQGSWVWADFMPLLEAVGLSSHAVDLPGNGADDTPMQDVNLDLYVRHLGELIDAIGRPVSLVGHSGGGAVCTAVAEAFADKVSRIAYVAGMMLPSGMTFGDMLSRERAAERGLLGIGPFLQWSPDRTVSTVPPDAGARIFLNDVPPETALRHARHLTPQAEAGRAVAVGWTAERVGRLPRLYVECSRDLSIAPELQRRMQDLVPGAVRVMLDAGHAPHVSAPGELAEVLIPFLQE